MVPKNTDWSILAHCDFFAVERFVQSVDRPAMRTIEPINEGVFERKLRTDSHWREVFDVISRAYAKLKPDFKIQFANFGGYCLVYKGKNTFFPPFVFKRSPVGFVSSVKRGNFTNLSVMSSERTGEQLILLGPVRFINSDCNPNSEYDFSRDSGIVQFRAIRKIKPRNELFVKYGPEFFDFSACLCRTCRIRKNETQFLDEAFDILLVDVISNVIDEILTEIESETLIVCRPILPPKKKLRGRKLIEKVNELISSPQSDDGSPFRSNVYNAFKARKLHFSPV